MATVFDLKQIYPYAYILLISILASMSRSILLPPSDGLTFSRLFAFTSGAACLGLLFGMVLQPLVPSEWVNAAVAVAASSSREILQVVVKRVKSINIDDLFRKKT